MAEPQADPLVRPFTAIRPAPQYAAEVAAPPYDVLNTAEARTAVRGRQWSFLRVSKAEIDLAEGTNPYTPEVYAQAGRTFRAMVNAGVLRRDPAPCYYAYRMETGDHAQTGIVVGASVAAYDVNRIREHELTRPEKEDDRVRQIEALEAQTGPVLLTHKCHPELSRQVAEVTALAPAYAVDCCGARHSLWVIDDPDRIARISEAFNGMEALYIADGHHRSAAASRVAHARMDAGRGADPFEAFLAVSFPTDQMLILPYNRVVTNLHGLSEDVFRERLGRSFRVSVSDGPVQPERAQSFGMYLAGRWYSLKLARPVPDDAPPNERLDVNILSSELLLPVLGITDIRRDPRIDFVGGARGLDELERRVDSGEMAVAFSCYRTGLDQLIEVADAGGVMPPKSTWFEPKLADGLVSFPLD